MRAGEGYTRFCYGRHVARPRSSKGGFEPSTLFAAAARREAVSTGAVPLAERMRPARVEDYVGQEHLVGAGQAARARDRQGSRALDDPLGPARRRQDDARRASSPRGRSPSSSRSPPCSASIQELREIVAAAKERLDYRGERTILFVDEIHRFNKAQQDAFLPHVEAGTITLIGATTENPSFAVNAALLSRCKVFRLESLGEEALVAILERALGDTRAGPRRTASRGRRRGAPGDRAARARRRAARALDARGRRRVRAVARADGDHDRERSPRSEEKAPLLYDKSGEEHYNVISAFIKSMRGSDPDAAIYWMMRMLEAGDDPLFVLRRMMIFASEDVGNADPRALDRRDERRRRVPAHGHARGPLPAGARGALSRVRAQVERGEERVAARARRSSSEHGALPVPMKLRNAVTKLMKQEGYGAGYQYAHDYDDGVVPGETYLPDELVGEPIYEPTEHGEETRIRARLAGLRQAAAARRGDGED